MQVDHDSILEQCKAHIERSKPLPAPAYTSPEFLQHEQETVFTDNWVCVGFTSDVPNPGDIFPLALAGKNLLITRADDGEVRVFHNYCRHRGMKLAEEASSQVPRLVCPYHCWTYSLDGTLLRTPHICGPGKHTPEDGAELPAGLEPVAFAIWHRLIFVNLSGKAGPFKDHISDLEQRWSCYDFSDLHPAASAVLPVESNWKLAIENFVDVYHVPYVHPGLNQYNSFDDHYYVHHPKLFGEGNDTVTPDDCAVGRFSDFPGLPADKQTTLEALCLFPNLLITVTRDHLRCILVTPTGPESCLERVQIFIHGEQSSTAEDLATERQQLLRRFMDFNDEDVDIVQKLQTSMHSEFRQGHYSTFFDESVRLFHTALIDSMKAR